MKYAPTVSTASMFQCLRFGKSNESKRIKELEAELEFTKSALDLTKSSVCFRLDTFP